MFVHVYCHSVCLLAVICGCLAQTSGESLDCHGTVHKNGSTSYFLNGQRSANCATEWTANGTVIAYKDEDESIDNDTVLDQTPAFLRTKTCMENVQYKEDCPSLPVPHRTVLCSCDCRVTDRHSTVTQSTEIPTITSPGPVEAQALYQAGLKKRGMVVTVIVVVVILILGCFFAAFWLWKKRRRWCAGVQRPVYA
ncbi:hypothetical protein AGOR_G00209040 [Albula goreensis]|uniref:Uncharacterized protein n=1 Tax=Albula goreensis TaxID=1534307 RepID=A0A8T3CPM5_9TELE|nr:hypothetical protein AGOR_G00209040 [Albula goreensis]